MTAETEFRAACVDSGTASGAALVALVGQKVAADRIEQGTARPFVVFTRVDTERFHGLDGTQHGSKAVLEVQCWADNRSSAEAVATAVEAVCAAQCQLVIRRTGGYDGDLDLEAALLTVEWWE